MISTMEISVSVKPIFFFFLLHQKLKVQDHLHGVQGLPITCSDQYPPRDC